MIWTVLLYSIYGGTVTALVAITVMVTQHHSFKDATKDSTEGDTAEEDNKKRKLLLKLALCLHIGICTIPWANTGYLVFVLWAFNSGKDQEKFFSDYYKLQRTRFLEYIARFNPKARALRRTFDENLHIDE